MRRSLGITSDRAKYLCVSLFYIELRHFLNSTFFGNREWKQIMHGSMSCATHKLVEIIRIPYGIPPGSGSPSTHSFFFGDFRVDAVSCHCWLDVDVVVLVVILLPSSPENVELASPFDMESEMTWKSEAPAPLIYPPLSPIPHLRLIASWPSPSSTHSNPIPILRQMLIWFRFSFRFSSIAL